MFCVNSVSFLFLLILPLTKIKLHGRIQSYDHSGMNLENYNPAYILNYSIIPAAIIALSMEMDFLKPIQSPPIFSEHLLRPAPELGGTSTFGRSVPIQRA